VIARLIEPLVVEAMIWHARYERPAEACGLLGVDGEGSVRFVYCLTNSVHAPDSFTISPHEYFGAALHAERNGWEIAGLFHSHPAGPLVPSSTDRVNAPGSGWLYVIVGIDEARVYRLVRGQFELIGAERVS